MTLLVVTLCILSLILLITWGKVNAFLAFLIVSIFTGLGLGIPIDKITGSVQKGIGDTLGSLVIVVVLGAMLGKLVAESGAAQRIANVMMKAFGEKYIHWALMITGLVVGIPLFYNVGFVLMIPLIFSVAYTYKLPSVYIGVPMLSALSVTHGFLPPHPSPAALVTQFNADMGWTLVYGLMVSIPAIIVAGPIFAQTLKHMVSKPLEGFVVQNIPSEKLPGITNSLLSSLFPVFMLMLTTLLLVFVPKEGAQHDWLKFIGEPNIVMLLAVILATFSLGMKQGRSISSIMNVYADAAKDVAMILLIVSGAGILKQVLLDSGVSDEIANVLKGWTLHPLILGWLIAAIIRVCLGSATVAGLTTAGIIAPLMQQIPVDPNLMVLSIGAGSLMFSHVNDAGFWLFKEYFNLSIKQTIRSWSIMESLVSVVGLAGVMIIDFIISQ